MTNNLERLIKENGLSKIEFGIRAFNLPDKTDNEVQAIRNKVNRYCKKDLKTVHLNVMDKFCKILKCDYNTLYGYAETQ